MSLTTLRQLLSSGPAWLGAPGPGGKNQVRLSNILGSATCPLAESPVTKGGDFTVGVYHLHGSLAEEWNLSEVREIPRTIQASRTFSSQIETQYRLSNHSPFPPPLCPWELPIYCLSLRITYPGHVIQKGIIQYVSFCV